VEEVPFDPTKDKEHEKYKCENEGSSLHQYAVAKILASCYIDRQQISIHHWPVTSPIASSKVSFYRIKN